MLFSDSLPAWTPLFGVWLAGLLAVFLPIELYAAVATPVKTDTFSEFIWWVFGVRPRKSGRPVRWAVFRRATLAAECVSLTLHFVAAMSFVPVAIYGAGCAGIMVYAVAFEREA